MAYFTAPLNQDEVAKRREQIALAGQIASKTGVGRGQVRHAMHEQSMGRGEPTFDQTLDRTVRQSHESDQRLHQTMENPVNAMRQGAAQTAKSPSAPAPAAAPASAPKFDPAVETAAQGYRSMLSSVPAGPERDAMMKQVDQLITSGADPAQAQKLMKAWAADAKMKYDQRVHQAAVTSAVTGFKGNSIDQQTGEDQQRLSIWAQFQGQGNPNGNLDAHMRALQGGAVAQHLAAQRAAREVQPAQADPMVQQQAYDAVGARVSGDPRQRYGTTGQQLEKQIGQQAEAHALGMSQEGLKEKNYQEKLRKQTDKLTLAGLKEDVKNKEFSRELAKMELATKESIAKIMAGGQAEVAKYGLSAEQFKAYGQSMVAVTSILSGLRDQYARQVAKLREEAAKEKTENGESAAYLSKLNEIAETEQAYQTSVAPINAQLVLINGMLAQASGLSDEQKKALGLKLGESVYSLTESVERATQGGSAPSPHATGGSTPNIGQSGSVRTYNRDGSTKSKSTSPVVLTGETSE